MDLQFAIRFYSTFRVGAAYPRDGLDLVYDEAEPLPADHIKGLMRAEARRLAAALKLPVDLVDTVFGTPGIPSAWAWESATPDPAWKPAILRHRVAIDPQSGTAKQDHLVASTATYADRATFRITYIGAAHATTASAASPLEHQAALLRLSARSVHHVGGWRRRGLGWVGVTVVGAADQAEANKQVCQDLALLTEHSAAPGGAN